ncbi:hypothetical protein D3C80_1421460 [compost metagenome]
MTLPCISLVQSLALAAVIGSMVPSSMRWMQWSTKTRARVAWVSASASLKRVFCNSSKGLPNTLRSRTYSTVSRTAVSMVATEPTAQPIRS